MNPLSFAFLSTAAAAAVALALLPVQPEHTSSVAPHTIASPVVSHGTAGLADQHAGHGTE